MKKRKTCLLWPCENNERGETMKEGIQMEPAYPSTSAGLQHPNLESRGEYIRPRPPTKAVKLKNGN